MPDDKTITEMMASLAHSGLIVSARGA